MKFVSFLLALGPIFGQFPLSPAQQKSFSRFFDEGRHADSLSCRVETLKPFFDFSFRYEVGYFLACPLGQFEGRPATLGTVLRIKPAGGGTTVLGQSFALPTVTDEMRGRIKFKKLEAEVEISGVFAAGEGDYGIDLAVLDDRERLFRKSWRVKAHPQGNEGQARVALEPGSVAAISLPSWEGLAPDGMGLRLTVLLNAAPMNPHSTKLRAWDRAFLLGALSSVLRCLPLASVRLIAFNLDQQLELYRDLDFDSKGLTRLADALTRLELGTIQYRVLRQSNGWADLLSRLVRNEINHRDKTDAVLFVGSNLRMEGRIAPEMLGKGNRRATPFFYFEYFPQRGAEFPDSIQHLVSDLDGVTFKLHSPGDLAQAIAKMEKHLKVDQR